LGDLQLNSLAKRPLSKVSWQENSVAGLPTMKSSFVARDVQFNSSYAFSSPCKKDLDIYVQTLSAKDPLIMGLFCGKRPKEPFDMGLFCGKLSKVPFIMRLFCIKRPGRIWHPMHLCLLIFTGFAAMGWLQLVGSIKLQVSFAKETHKRANILEKRPIILWILLTVAIPYSLPSSQ